MTSRHRGFRTLQHASESSFRGPTRSSVDTLVVDLQFDESRTASRARISYTGANARALVTGFFEGVSACIATHPARNGWIHPASFWDGAIGALTFVVFWAATWSWTKATPPIAWSVSAVWLLMFTFTSVAPRFKPYTLFESNRSERLVRAWDWLAKGLLGFLIFGTLLTVLRDHIRTLVLGGS